MLLCQIMERHCQRMGNGEEIHVITNMQAITNYYKSLQIIITNMQIANLLITRQQFSTRNNNNVFNIAIFKVIFECI